MIEPKNNCSLSEEALVPIMIRDQAETLECFGQEYLDEYGRYVPEELIERYRKNQRRLISTGKAGLIGTITADPDPSRAF
jgi:hypothetical protein